MTASEIFDLIAPELLSNINKTSALDLAEIQIKADFCGDKRPMLVAYLAAHILSMSLRGSAAAGSLTSISEGSLSLGFSGSGSVMGALGQTQYGVEFDRLSRSCVFAIRTRVQSV